jgi:uncharacterized OsmC-like protein
MEAEKVINGVNIDSLFSTVGAIKNNPEIAKFKFRAANKWIDATHSRATISGFYGAGKEDNSREPMLIDQDEPPVLLGKNQGANPVEYLLVALSGCLTTTLIAHASARRIKIKKVESRYEGYLDLRGFLGIAEDVKVGYENIRVYFKVDADISNDQKEELVRIAQKYSPVFNMIANGVNVSVQLEKN